MFEKTIHIALLSPLLLAFGICAATGKPRSESAAAPTEIAYLCQLPDGRSVRTALPQGRCRPIGSAEAQTAEAAASASADTVAIPNGQPAAAQADNSELPDIWQEALAAASDVQVTRPVPVQVTLRRQPETDRRAAFRPAQIIQAARPSTPKEIITRDIRREERALAQAERDLANARRSNQATRASALQLQISDRRSGLNSLRQELRRHQ